MVEFGRGDGGAANPISSTQREKMCFEFHIITGRLISPSIIYKNGNIYYGQLFLWPLMFKGGLQW